MLTSELQSDMTGDIVTCSGSVLRLWTVNGVLLASVPTNQFVDPITAVAFSLASPFLLPICAHCSYHPAERDDTRYRDWASCRQDSAMAAGLVRFSHR
jgi:hypothetical protein